MTRLGVPLPIDSSSLSRSLPVPARKLPFLWVNFRVTVKATEKGSPRPETISTNRVYRAGTAAIGPAFPVLGTGQATEATIVAAVESPTIAFRTAICILQVYRCRGQRERTSCQQNP
jgi:hypothetical protein